MARMRLGLWEEDPAPMNVNFSITILYLFYPAVLIASEKCVSEKGPRPIGVCDRIILFRRCLLTGYGIEEVCSGSQDGLDGLHFFGCKIPSGGCGNALLNLLDPTGADQGGSHGGVAQDPGQRPLRQGLPAGMG
jgi:hypothetical protein